MYINSYKIKVIPVYFMGIPIISVVFQYFSKSCDRNSGTVFSSFP